MRGALSTGVLLLLSFAPGCYDLTPLAASPSPAPAHVVNVPSWVPPLTPQQTALLLPPDRAVKTVADRVFPDLERFGYADNRPLGSDDQALQFAAMVTKVLNDSPRFYALGEAPKEAANVIGQYGPQAGDPDGFKIVTRRADGIGELVAAPGADEARPVLARGTDLAKGGNLPGALEVFRAGVAKYPQVIALQMALAEGLVASGDLQGGDAAYRAAIAMDPTFGPAHLGHAELALRRNDLGTARGETIEGLAYDPPSKRGLGLAMALAQRSAHSGKGSAVDGGWVDPPPGPVVVAATERVDPFLVFLDVDAKGAIHVATSKSEAAQVYGGCRAAMRFEPEVRAHFFHQPAETPYFLNVVEEVVCVEAALGAYLSAKASGGAVDENLEKLLSLARSEGLTGYAMFEVLGSHRPERARAAPPEVHRAIAGYVEHGVLTRRAPVVGGI